MAKIHVTTFVPDGQFFPGLYNEALFAVKQTKTLIELHQENNAPDYIVVHGKDLTYRNGFITGGTITDMEFKDGLSNDYATAKDIGYKITDKIDISEQSAATFFFLTVLSDDTVKGSFEDDVLYGYQGNDTLIGLNGDDHLVAGIAGKDVMTGKLGSDVFAFADGSHKVVVTDFDAVGGGTAQDYFSFDQDVFDPRIYKDHHDTVLDFGHGHTMRLVGVDRADVSMDDYQLPPLLA